MALPTKAKTWTYTINQRSTYVSVSSVTKDILFGLKQAWKAMFGATVVGSCDGSDPGVGTTMDGVDRWPTAASIGNAGGGNAAPITSATPWFVIQLVNGCQIMMANCANGSPTNALRLAYSPSGVYTAQGTRTFPPTATDEVIIFSANSPNHELHPSTTSGDRMWHTAVSSDGLALWWFISRAGVISHGGVFQACSPVNTAVTFSPPMIGFRWQANPTLALFISITASISAYVGGLVISASGVSNSFLSLGGEAYGSSLSAATRTTFAPELQNSEHALYPVSIWSETPGARGKLGYLYDFWMGQTGAADGDTYPNDASNLFVAVGDWVLPWNGSAVTLT
jgi:hypothetical protein